MPDSEQADTPHPTGDGTHLLPPPARFAGVLGREALIAVAAFLAYFLVRGAMESNYERAHANSLHVVAFQDSLGIAFEPQIQDVILGHELLIDVANWIYIWGHWPVIASVAVYLVWRGPGNYRLYRNAFLISGGIGLIIFATFPVAPPRLVDPGLIDTITERSRAYRVLQPAAFTNQYAAMPSLHFGWNMLMGIALYTCARARILRVLGLLLPVAMGFAVVATANHYIIDAVAGGAVALAGLYLALRVQQRNVAQPVPEPGADR